MLRNLFLTGLRHLRRRKLFAGLNVAGLAVGIGSFLLIGLFLHHELSHDRHFPDHDRIFRVVLERPVATEGSEMRVVLPQPIGPELVESFAEVERSVRVAAGSMSTQLVAGEREARVETLLSADPSFFEVFEMRSVAGDARRGLESPGSIVLTESLARALFGDADAAGQTVAFAGSTDGILVTAVVADPPRATHLPFDAVMHRQGNEDPRWNYFSVRTYVRLAPAASRETFEASLPRFVRQHINLDYPHEDEYAERHRLWLQPLTDVHLAGDVTTATATTSPARYVQIFGLVALLLLGIGCINYVNLSTAYATERAREVGMRRTLGATRRQVGMQFVAESLLVSLLALPMAWALMSLVLPRFSEISGVAFGQADLFSVDFLAVGLGVACIVGLLSGVYPAFALSRFSPRRVMTDETGGRGGGARLRQVLVVMQFAASAALIICALTISRQMDLVREARMGGIDQQMVMLFVGGSAGEKESFKEAAVASPDVAAASYGPAPNTTSGSAPYRDPETQTEVTVRSIIVDEDYLETLGLELAAGEPLTRETAVPQGRPVLLNETALHVLGATLGEHHPALNVTPVGVVRDYHFVPLHEPISPLFMNLAPNNWNPLLVRLEAGRMQDGLEHIRQVWADLRPDRPFEVRFLDEELDKSYHAEIRMGALFRAMTLLTLFLAGLGLFGLAAFAAQQRTREIGIRKVLGASVTSIVVLLTRRFVLLVLLSLVIAAPPAYLAMRRWLEDFAYRIELGPGVLVATGALALLVAVATVSYHALRAALTDPVRTLRSE
jgi:putative ABC transport system permease protein